MRYNNETLNYKKYIEIKRIERKMPEKTSQIQINHELKVLDNLNKDINKFSKELEYSKARYHFFEQKVCAHDFGVIINKYTNDEGIIYNSGICLECGAEINEKEAPIFSHSVYITEETSGALNIDDYKNKLDSLKKKYSYYNSAYSEEVGEMIVNEMYEEAKTLKRKFKRSK